MSIDRRQPGTWDNKESPGGPAILKEIITRDLGELSTQDKEAIKNAGGAFIRYTAFVDWKCRTVLGAGLGGMLALRGRYSFSQWKNLPRLFPNGFTSSPNQEALRDRLGFFLRATAYSMGGIIVGQSVGFIAGTWRSSQIIKREGNYENIEKVMKRVQQDIKEGYGKANQDSRDPYANQGRTLPPAQRRKLQGVEQLPKTYDDNSKLGRPFVPDSTPAEETAWKANNFSKDISSNNDDFYGTAKADSSTSSSSAGTEAQTSSRKSRWEELRGTRDSRDSAWERIRQNNAREDWQTSKAAADAAAAAAAVPPTVDGSGLLEDRPSSEMFDEEKKRSEDERKRALSKERERLEYEKMFERESKGVDSIYQTKSR